MFHKIQLRLTLFAGAITTIVLLIMTFGYIHISENNLIENRLHSYQNDIYTISLNLEQQQIISHNWLSKLTQNNNYYISITDNGIPFLYNSLNNNHTSILDEAWNTFNSESTIFEQTTISYKSFCQTFSFTASDNNEYIAFIINTQNNHSVLEMLLVSPLSSLNEQILRQRLTFLSIVITAIFVLYIFSWFFVGKLLRPIEESRKQQNHFIAAASHELRTPLSVILSGVENIQESEKSAPFNQTLSVLHDESVRMSRLLEDLLTLSSQSENFFSITKSSVEPDTLILTAYETFEIMAKTKDLKLSVSLPENVIPAANWDKSRMEQVLAILLHNAISYTPSGGNINLSLEMQKDKYIITVSDSGIGISDDEKAKIFDRFYRSETSRSGKGHFGLGLSIAAGIVKAHHGKISVKDNENGGAVFMVTIPQ